MRPIRIFGKVIGVMAIVTLATMAFGYVVMHLWNWLIPAIFIGVKTITFWQAIGILILAKILFRSGGGHGRHRGWGWGRGRNCGPGGRWGQWNDKWQTMTPEEREQMKAEWKGGWYSWKQRWHDLSPEEREKMKAQWKERCSNWENRFQRPAEAPKTESENKESVA